MTEKKETTPTTDLATEAVLAAMHGEKEDVLHFQHAMIQEEVKERTAIKRTKVYGSQGSIWTGNYLTAVQDTKPMP